MNSQRAGAKITYSCMVETPTLPASLSPAPPTLSRSPQSIRKCSLCLQNDIGRNKAGSFCHGVLESQERGSQAERTVGGVPRGEALPSAPPLQAAWACPGSCRLRQFSEPWQASPCLPRTPGSGCLVLLCFLQLCT